MWGKNVWKVNGKLWPQKALSKFTQGRSFSFWQSPFEQLFGHLHLPADGGVVQGRGEVREDLLVDVLAQVEASLHLLQAAGRRGLIQGGGHARDLAA